MKLSYIVSILIFTATAFAQSDPDSLWNQSFGGTDRNFAQAMRLCEDGGYAMLGNTIEGVVHAISVVKTDSTGAIQWNRAYYEGREFKAADLQPTEDGGFIIAGAVQNPADSSDRMYLLRLDGRGDTLWSGAYGTASCRAYAVQPTADGGFVAAGWVEAESGFHLQLIRTDEYGKLEWIRTYGGGDNLWPKALRLTGDGGFVVAGQSHPGPRGESRMYVAKIDRDGALQWWQSFQCQDACSADDVLETANGYVLAGTTWYSSPEEGDFCVAMVDREGHPLWQNTHRQGYDFHDRVVLRSSGDGVLVAAYRFCLGKGDRNMCVIRLDESGEMHWCRYYSQTREHTHEWNGGYYFYSGADDFGRGLHDFFGLPSLPDTVQCSITHTASIPARYGRRWWQKYGFISGAVISFSLPSSQQVRIDVMDNEGKLIRTITDDYYLAGQHTDVVNGGLLAPGIYFVAFRAGAFAKMEKMVVVG